MGRGIVRSPIRSPLPLTATLARVMVALPVFLRTKVWVFVVPVATVPKLALAGVEISVPEDWPEAALTPVPFTENELVKLPVNEYTPEAKPELRGANLTASAIL